jgi:hypothetical protein
MARSFLNGNLGLILAIFLAFPRRIPRIMDSFWIFALALSAMPRCL